MVDDIKKLNDKLFEISQQQQNADNTKGLPGVNKTTPGTYSREDFLREQQQSDYNFANSVFGDNRNIGLEYLENAGNNPSSYDEDITEAYQLQDVNGFRANQQSGLLKGFNSIVSGAISGLATAVEDMGYLLDFEDHIKSFTNLDRDRDNWLSSMMRDAKDSLYQGMPVYEQESDTALGQFFKFSTLRGILDSAIGFAIPGGFIGKGVGALGKLSHVGSLTGKLMAANKASAGAKVLANVLGEGAKDLTAGAISNYAEGQMMAIELGENIKSQYIEDRAQKYFDKFKGTEFEVNIDQARRLAEDDFNKDTAIQEKIGKEQANFVLRNRAFALTDAIGLHGLTKSKAGFRKALLNNPKEKLQVLKNFSRLSADNPLIQSAKEAGEEIGQNIIQSEGEYQVRKASDLMTEEDEKLGDTFWERALAFGTSKQAIVEGLMGAVSGPGQRIISTIVADAKAGDPLGIKRRNEEYEEYMKQQNFISTIEGKVNNIVKAEALKAEAIARGDEVTADAIWNKEAADLISDSIENGTIEALERSVNDIIEDNNKTPEEKDQAKRLVKFINDVENEHIVASDNVNSKDIFQNRVHHLLYQDWANNIKSEVLKKVDALNQALSTKSSDLKASLNSNMELDYFGPLNSNSEIIQRIAQQVPEEYNALKNSMKQYKDIKGILDNTDFEYNKLTDPKFQENWLIKEANRIQRELEDKEKQAILSYVNMPLVKVNNSNQAIAGTEAKVVKDGNNYFLREYNEDTEAYDKPVLVEDGKERPVTSNDLTEYANAGNVNATSTPNTTPAPATTNTTSTTQATTGPTIPTFTTERQQQLKTASESINNLDDLNFWKEKASSNVSEEEAEEVERLYNKALERIVKSEENNTQVSTPTTNEAAPEQVFERTESLETPESNNSLWDAFKRSVRNYWFGSKGSEVASRKNGNKDQIRWYDFLNSHPMLNYSGIIIPFKYNGRTAGRLVLTDKNGNFIDENGNSIGKEFDADRAVYTTVADPSTDPEGKYFGSKTEFEYYKQSYIQNVWQYLEKGLSVPVTFTGVSTGIIDEKHKDSVVKAPSQLKPLKDSLPSNMKMEDLTVYVSTSGQIITTNGETFTVPPGSIAIHNAANDTFYRANSVPIREDFRNFIIELTRHYLNKSINGNTFKSNARYVLKAGSQYMHYDFFSILRDTLRYGNSGNPTRTIYCIKDSEGKYTSRWNIGGTEIEAVISQDGKLIINEEFINLLNKFLYNSFYNPRLSKLDPNSKEEFLFPTEVYKNGTLKATKYSNYHEFVKENLVDFVSNPNDPYAHVERYVKYDPLEVNVVEENETKEASIDTYKEHLHNGKKLNVKVTFEINGNRGSSEFEVSENNGEYHSDKENKLAAKIFVDSLGNADSMDALSDIITSKFNEVGAEQHDKIQIEITPKEDETPGLKEVLQGNVDPKIAALEQKIAATTNPAVKAALEKSLAKLKAEGNNSPSLNNTQVLTSTKFSKTYKKSIVDTKEELAKARKWFEKKFPGIDFEVVDRAVSQNIAGKFENSVVTIYQGGNTQTVYHEAFHVILDCILNADERINLIKKAISNKEYEHYFNKLKPLYPELSQEELAEEVLAEAFADYMVMEDENDSFINKIFRKLKDIITSFYNIFRKDGKRNREWASSIETIVNHVRSKNYLTYDSPILKARGKHYKMIPGLDAITTADAVNGVHYWVIQHFKKSGNLMDILGSDNSKILAEAYEYAKAEFRAREEELTNSMIAAEDEAEIIAISSEIEKIEAVLNTWDMPQGVKDLHQKERLAQYKLELNTAIDSQEASSEIAEGENNQGRDSAALFAESITVSSKMNSNKIVKLLLSTLPKKHYDFNTRTATPYRNSLGMPEVEPFGKVYNILANKLANFPPSVSVQEITKRLEELAIEYPSINILIKDEQITIRTENGLTTITVPSFLKLDKVDSWTASDALQFTQFLQAFNNNRNQYMIGITKKGGQYVTFNASSKGQRDKIVGTWRAQLSKWLLSNNAYIARFYTRDSHKRVVYNAAEFKKAFPRIPQGEEILTFLGTLGITFNIQNPNFIQKILHTKEVLEKVGQLHMQITSGKLTTPVVYENYEGRNESLDAFTDAQVTYGIDTLENSHISLEDKRIYDLGKPGFINQVINKLNRLLTSPARMKKELPYLDPSNNVYTTHSILINRMMTDPRSSKLALYIHEGNKEDQSGASVAYKDMKLLDKFATVFNLVMEGKDDIMRPADNGQERFFDHGEPWVNSNTTKKELKEIFIGYLWDELARSHEKDRAFTNFAKNYNKGVMMENLLTPSEIKELIVDTTESPSEFADRIIAKLGNDVLSSRINNMIEAWTNNIYNKFVDLGGLVDQGNGNVYNACLKIGSDENTKYFSKDAVLSWLKHGVVNYAIGNIEQSKFLYGDNVFYASLGDEFKRHNGAMGTKKTCLVTDAINNSIKKYFKRIDKAEGLVDKNGAPILRTMVFSDVPAYSKELYLIAEIIDQNNSKYQSLKARIQKEFDNSDKNISFQDLMTKALIKEADNLELNCASYANMKEGDGFGMISLDAYRELKVRVGDWSEEAERLYQWEVQEREGVPEKDRVFTDFYGKTTPLEKGSWGKQVFNSLKPQHFGPLANVSGYKPSFYKLSLMPLIPSVLKSVGNTNLSHLHELMIKNQVSVAVHYSANKGVTTKTNSVQNDAGYTVTNKEHPFNDFYDENGNFLIDKEGNYHGPLEILTQDTYWESWGIQVDTGEHRHHDVITGTQMMVQILNGIYDGGKVSEHFGENATKVGNLADEYIKLNGERIRIGKEQLIKSLGLVAKESGWEISEEGIKELVNSLRSEAIERGLADNYISAIELLGTLKDGTTNIDILPTREKIESILMSTAARMTTSQKRNGTAAYQVPSTMWETKASREYNEGKYRSSDLNFVVKNVDGKPKITSMEVYLPSPFKGIMDTGKVPKELLELIGFRIPTQGLSSIETLVIKGFLPESAGDIIVLPSEIVAKAGSD